MRGSVSQGTGTISVLSTIANIENTTTAQATDEIGNPRTANGAIYLGAIELQPLPPPPSPPAPPSPPSLQTPPLLAFFDALLGAIETVNSNGTVTVIDRLFGIPLLASTYNSSGGLQSVTLFGINITFLFS